MSKSAFALLFSFTALFAQSLSSETIINGNESDPVSNGSYSPPCPTITFNTTPTNTCSGSTNGKITITGESGGAGPYTYSKDNGANYQSGATFTGLAAGTYNVVIMDANGCFSATTQIAVGTFSAPACSVNGPDYVCNNSAGNIYTAPAGMSAYSWSISANGSIPGSTTGQSVAVTAGNYLQSYIVSVTVTDANGCTSSCSKQSDIFLFTPPANITVNPNPACFGVTLDLSVSAAASSTVSWSGEGISNPSGNPSTTALPTTSGPHTYGVTVTTDYGCSNTGTALVTVNPLPASTITGPSSACVGVSFDLSVSAAASSTVSWSGEGIGNPNGNPSTSVLPTTSGPHAYDVTVTADNGCSNTGTALVTVYPLPVSTITGPSSVCSGGNVTLDAGAGYSSYAWSGGGGSGQTATYNNITSPTTYTVTVTSNGCTGTGTHSVTIQTCNSNIEFSGKILWEHDDVTGVKDATVSLTGSATGSAVTNVNGDFLITTGLASGSFTLKPTKTINKLNGVTAADITAIQQHVANTVLITDNYKKVCADVNKSNSITSLDASIINQSLLGNPTALGQFKTSWRFVPSSYPMPNPPWGFPEERIYTAISAPQTNQDFIGMKTGDVTGDAAPANFGPGNSLIFNVQDQILQSGTDLLAEFSADQLDDLAAFQLALHFDPAQLQLIAIDPADGSALPLTIDNFGLYNIDEGEIRAVWSQPTGLPVGEAAPLFRLHFTALQSGAKLSEVLHLDNAVLPGFAYNSVLEESKVVLKFSELTTGTGNFAGNGNFQLLQNQPNPFNGTTTIGFILPEGCEASLRIFDTNGRLLRWHSGYYPAGRNAADFDFGDEVSSGLLYYELTTPFGVLSRKMMVNR